MHRTRSALVLAAVLLRLRRLRVATPPTRPRPARASSPPSATSSSSAIRLARRRSTATPRPAPRASAPAAPRGTPRVPPARATTQATPAPASTTTGTSPAPTCWRAPPRRAAATSASDERRTGPIPSAMLRAPRIAPPGGSSCRVASVAPSSPSPRWPASAAFAQSAPKLDLPRPSPKGSVTQTVGPHRHLGRLLEPGGEGPEDLGRGGALRPGLARRGQRVHQGDLLHPGLHRGQAGRRRARTASSSSPRNPAGRSSSARTPSRRGRATTSRARTPSASRPPPPPSRRASVWPSPSSTSTTRRARWRWSGTPSGWE